MAEVRTVKRHLRAQQVTEGAGVKLKRVFGYEFRLETDPFLLLDHFGSDYPSDYLSGFPWHPHRGIETVTYMLDGTVEHADSLGNIGTIHPGDIQWMTAGSGIIHQEMPKPNNGLMYGFQLWVNLPKIHKMTNPRYREIKTNDIPSIERPDSLIKLISGKYKKTVGAVNELFTDIVYLDIKLWSDSLFELPVEKDYNFMIYTYDGIIEIPRWTGYIRSEECVILSKGDTISIKAGSDGSRILIIGGKPLNEPIAWHGPIVMNTEEELDTAFNEFNNNTFIKYNPKNS